VNEVASLPALILSGKLLITPGSEEVKVRMGDFAYIPSYQHHAFKNISETDEEHLLALFCPRGKEGCSPPPSSNAKKD
jgi:quercetin dioxygenase-like cupin family protein